MKTLTLFALLLVGAAPAFAMPDGGAPDMGAAGTVSAPDPTVDPGAFIQVIGEAAHAHNYRLLTALALILVVAAARKLVPMVHGKVGAFLNTDRGGACLVLFLSLIGGAINALLEGGPMSLKMLGTAMYVSFLAAGGYSLVKKTGVMVLLRPLLSKAGIAAALVLCMSASGCAWLKKHPKVAGELGCAEQAIVAAIPTVLSDVAEVLSGSSPNWGGLLTLEEQHGMATIGCAVDQLLAQKGAAGSARAQFEANARLYKSEGGATGHAQKLFKAAQASAARASHTEVMTAGGTLTIPAVRQ